MEVEKEIEFIKEEMKSVKRQVYDNKDSITTLSLVTKALDVTLNKLEVSITKLVDKMDAYITKQNEDDKKETKEKLNKYEKVIWFLKSTVLGGCATIIIAITLEYISAIIKGGWL